MSRIWWATIIGLIAGAAILTMVQRGCAAGAEVDRLRAAERLDVREPALPPAGARNLAPVTIDAVTPNLGRFQRPADRPAPPQPAATANPTLTPEPPAPGLTRDERREQNLSRLEERQRAAEERRRLLEERRAQSRELTRRLAVESGQLDPRDARRVTQPITRASAEEAQRRFRQQLTNPSAASAGDDGRSRGEGGASDPSGAGDRPGIDGESSDLLDALPADARRALEDLGGIPNQPNAGAGLSEQPPIDTRYRSQDFPTPEELAPVPRWESVATGSASDGRVVASSDLFLGFLTRPSIPVITSLESSGLTARGGAFYTGPATVEGQRGPSSSAVLTPASGQPGAPATPLLSTFLTLGGAAPFYTPGSETNPAAFGATIASEWATTDFDNLRILQDPDRFGDDRFYIWVGRFAAAEGVRAVEGTLGVTWIDLASFSSIQVEIDVPNCSSCWSDLPEPPDDGGPSDPGDGSGDGSGDPGDDDPGDDPGDDAGPRIADASLSPATLTAGQTAQVAVTLREPAPPGGVSIALSVSDPAAATLAENRLSIPEGATTGLFNLVADEVVEPVAVIVSMTLGEQTVERRLSILPPTALLPSLDRISIVPQQILGGRTATGTVRLLEAAPASGAVVEVVSSSAAANPPAEVLIAPGARSADFAIPTSAVGADQTVRITVRLAGRERSAELVLKADVFGDVNQDGVVDSFDLADLLAATVGDYDPEADLDDDGDVDLDDLRILIELLESEGLGGSGGSGDLPLVARWIPVPRDDCEEIQGYRTADLYLGYLSPPSVVGVASPPVTGLSLENGAFYQHPLGNNDPPNPAVFDVAPCLRYDSHLTVGETMPLITPTFGTLDAADWGDNLVAEWLPSPGARIQVLQDPDFFGDDRHYVRILRVTVPVGVRSLTGTLETFTIAQGQNAVVDRDVVVHHCAACWGQYDLNADGVISDLDLEIMIALLGSDDEPEADLDGDGVVDLDDLRLLIAAIGT